jgi:type IV pilus assembly protein PilE
MKHAGTPTVRGFTLIELMITLTVLTILISIAYPAYRSYTTQARRADAKIALQQVANRLEKFYSYCNTYPTSAAPIVDAWPASCPPTPPAVIPNNVGLGLASALSPDSNYLVTMAVGNVTGTCSGAGANANCGYTLTANPGGAGTTGKQAGDGMFRLDALGAKHWDKNNDGDYADAGENTWK